jgi:hypothetical protein
MVAPVTINDTPRELVAEPVTPTTDFPIPWPVFSPPAFEVWVDGNRRDDWTFIGSFDTSAVPNTCIDGVVRFPAPGVTGRVAIASDYRPQRPNTLQYQEGVGIPARDHNAALNLAAAIDRDAFDKNLRAVRAPAGETMEPLPPASERARHVLTFDSKGDPIAAYLSGGEVLFPDIEQALEDIGELVEEAEDARDDAEAAAASATASAATATAQAGLAQNAAVAAGAAEDAAQDYATQAENAAAAALLDLDYVYGSVAEAEADPEVLTDDLYYVEPSQFADGFVDLYKRTSGGSTLRGTFPNRLGLAVLRNELAYTYDIFYDQLIWFDRAGMYPLGRGMYFPLTFQRNRKGFSTIAKNDIGPAAASGFTSHTFLPLPSTGAVYEIWLSLANGHTNARLKATTNAADLPTIDDGGYVHICTIRGNRISNAAFDIRTVTAPSGAKFRSNTVLDGQKLYVGYMAASNGDYAYADGANDGLFKEVYTVESGAATLWVCRDLAAGGAIVEIPQLERPQTPRYVVLAYRQQGFWSSDFPFLGPEFPFGSISNLSPAGRNDIDSADWYARGLSEVVDITDPHALALGFTKGLRANVIPVEFTNNIPRRLVEYGGRVIDSAPGKWVFAACLAITDTPNVFGNPSVILSHRDTLIPRSSPLGDFIVPVTPGPLYLVQKLSDYCAIFAGWVQVRADSDVTAIYVGSSVIHSAEVETTEQGEAETADVIICGVRFGISQDQSWVSEDDFGLPGGSLNVALPAMIGDKTGIAPIIYPSRVAVFGDGDLEFFPPAMFPKRTEGADPLMTVIGEAKEQPLQGEILDPQGNPYSIGRAELTALSRTGARQISLPISRLGDYLKIHVRFRSVGRSGLRERIDRVRVIHTNPALLENRSMPIFFLGDSLMASHGIAHSALRQMKAACPSFDPQTVGPATFDEREGFAPEPTLGFPIYGLAQGGRRWTEFTGEWVNFKDVPNFSYVENTPEAWAAYMAKTDAQKAVINPLLRKVVPPTWGTLADPSTLPTGTSSTVAATPDGVHIAAAHASTPFLWFGRKDGPTLSKLANPASLPSGTGSGVSWNHDGAKLFVGTSVSPFFSVYNRSGDTLTKVAGTPTLPGTCRGGAWTADGKNLIVVHDNAPYITVLNVAGDVYTPIAGPADVPLGNGRRCVLSPDGLTLAVVHLNSPGLIIYRLAGSGTSLTLTKLTEIDTLPTANGFAVAFHPLGHSLAVGVQAAPWLMIYSVGRVAGNEGAEGEKTFTLLTGTDGPQAADVPAVSPIGLTWSPDGTMFFLSQSTSASATLFETAGTTWTKVAGQPPATPSVSAVFLDNQTIIYTRTTTPFIGALTLVDGSDSARVRSYAWDLKGNRAPFTGLLPDFAFYFARSGQPIPKAAAVSTETNEFNDLENNTWPPPEWFESDRKQRLREAFDRCIEVFYDPTLPISLRAAMGPGGYVAHVLPPLARDNFMEQRFSYQQEIHAKIIAYFENLDGGARSRALAGHANANPEGAGWLIDHPQPVDPAFRPAGLPSRYAYAADFVHLYEDMRSALGFAIAAFFFEAAGEGIVALAPPLVPDIEDMEVAGTDAEHRRAFGFSASGYFLTYGVDLKWTADLDMEHRFAVTNEAGDLAIGVNPDGTVYVNLDAESRYGFAPPPEGLFSGPTFGTAPYGEGLATTLATDDGDVHTYTYRTDGSPTVALRGIMEPIIWFPSNGQSLDVGGGANDIPNVADKTSIKVPPRPHLALMFNDGVRGVSGNGSALNPPLLQDPAALVDFAPAFEQPRPNGALGETPGTAMMRMIAWLMEQSGRDPSPMVFRTHGRGGQPITGLNKRTNVYTNGMTETTRAAEIAAGIYRRPLLCHSVTWAQGPANRDDDRATYLAALMQLADDYDADIRAIIAAKAAEFPGAYAGVQLPDKIWFIIDQMAAPADAGDAGMPPLANVDAMEQSDKITIAASEYFLQGAYGLVDEVHTWPLGADVKGEYRALAWFRKVILGEDDTCLWPDRQKIERSGATIRVPWRGAVGKVVIDDDTLPPATNLGFEWEPSTGSAVITGATLDDDGAALITLGTGTAGTLRHAYSRQSTADSTGRPGNWGNIRDSAKTPSIAVPGLTLQNWALTFDAEVS